MHKSCSTLPYTKVEINSPITLKVGEATLTVVDYQLQSPAKLRIEQTNEEFTNTLRGILFCNGPTPKYDQKVTLLINNEEFHTLHDYDLNELSEKSSNQHNSAQWSFKFTYSLPIKSEIPPCDSQN